MKKKLFKYIKIFVSIVLILSLVAPSYASLSASDGSAFVTKAEFDSALADFNSRLTTFEAGINSKIDSQVTSYLDRNGIWSGKLCPSVRPSGKNYLIFYGEDNPNWTNEVEEVREFFICNEEYSTAQAVESMQGGSFVLINDKRTGETKTLVNNCNKSGLMVARVCLRYYWNFQYNLKGTISGNTSYWAGRFVADAARNVDDLINGTNDDGAWYGGLMPCWLRGKYASGTTSTLSKYYQMMSYAGATVKRTSQGAVTNVWETSFPLYTEDWNGSHYYYDTSRAQNLRPGDESPHVGQLLTFVSQGDSLEVSTWLQLTSRDANKNCFGLNSTLNKNTASIYLAIFAFDDLMIY